MKKHYKSVVAPYILSDWEEVEKIFNHLESKDYPKYIVVTGVLYELK